MRRAVIDWIAHCVRDDLAATPDVLWHYTTAEGLKGIAQDDHLWASQSIFLNDARELVYGIDLYFNTLAEADVTMLDKRTQAWLEHWASDEGATSVREWFRVNAAPFVACFCAKGDLLSQWRAYGPSGGYAVGFSQHPAQAWIQAGGHGLALRQVIYDEQQQRSQVGDIVSRLVNLLAGHGGTDVARQEFIRSTVDAIGQVAAYCKDPAFAEEQEWRVIYQRPEDPSPLQLHHRTAGNALVPYVHLPITAQIGARPSKLPIVRVRVGPNVDPTLGVLGATSLLRRNDYDAEVIASTAPLRLR